MFAGIMIKNLHVIVDHRFLYLSNRQDFLKLTIGDSNASSSEVFIKNLI